MLMQQRTSRGTKPIEVIFEGERKLVTRTITTVVLRVEKTAPVLSLSICMCLFMSLPWSLEKFVPYRGFTAPYLISTTIIHMSFKTKAQKENAEHKRQN